MPWWVALGLLGLLAWGVAAGIPLERRLWPWIVRRARRSTGRAALLAAGVQLGGLLAFAALSLVGLVVAQVTGNGRLAAVGVVPASLVYVPVLMVAMPSGHRGYDLTRKELRSVRATRAQARAATWSGAPFALVGAGIVFGVLFATFDA